MALSLTLKLITALLANLLVEPVLEGAIVLAYPALVLQSSVGLVVSVRRERFQIQELITAHNVTPAASDVLELEVAPVMSATHLRC